VRHRGMRSTLNREAALARLFHRGANFVAQNRI
jgi:hypothetical protein